MTDEPCPCGNPRPHNSTTSLVCITAAAYADWADLKRADEARKMEAS